MNKKYIVKLAAEERAGLQQMISAGKAGARNLLHARILLKADASAEGPCWTDEQISEALEVSLATIGGASAVCRAKPDRCAGASLAPRTASAPTGWGSRSTPDCSNLFGCPSRSRSLDHSSAG
jgi:hypothetical protein